MTRATAILASFCCLALSGLAPVRAQNTTQTPAAEPTQHPMARTAAARIPPYHKQPPKGPLPKTLDPKLFPDPLTQRVYAIAAKEKKILYQLPCYCGCDREAVHHKSLLDCYCDRHASFCATCKMEAVFAYQEHLKGKSVAQIRREIVAGKWRGVDLTPYSATVKVR